MTMSRLAKRAISLFAASGLVLVGLSAIAPAASAAGAIAAVTTSTTTGNTSTPFSLVTSSTCVSGNRVVAKIIGHGFPEAGFNIVGSTSTASVASGSGYTMPLLETLADSMAAQPTPVAFSGTYDLKVSCLAGLSPTSLGDFIGHIYFTSATDWTASLGTASLAPTTGTSDAGITVTSADLCPAGDKVQAKIFGAGFPIAGYNVTAKSTSDSVRSGSGYSIPLLETMASFAAAQDPAATLSGKYDVTLSCFSGLSSTVLGSSKTSLYFTSPTAFTTVLPVATTTTLASVGTPLSGASVDLNASVVPASAAGSVEFRDGLTLLGTTPVSAGAASYNVATIAPGAHSFTATFVPTNSSVEATSVSSAVAPTVAAIASSISPSTGTSDSGLTVSTVGRCYAGNKVQAKIFGAGFPIAGYNVTAKSTTDSVVSGTGYSIPLLETMASFAASQDPAATLSGKYDITVNCFSGLSSTVLGSSTTSLYFTTPTAFTTVLPVATTTTLAPVSTPLSGASLDLNASVVPASAAGSVEFRDGATLLGTTPVSAGAASYTVTSIAPGSHSFTATFVPTNSSVEATSVSSAVTTTVAAIAASVSPSSGTSDSGLTVSTVGRCYAGNRVQVKVFGAGFPAAGYNVSAKSTTDSVVSGTGYSIPLLETMASFAASQDPAATLSGTYNFVVNCYSGFSSTILGSAVTAINFSSPTAFGVGTPSTVPATPARPTALLGAITGGVAPRTSSASVSWTAPANGGTPITSYVVTASPSGPVCPATATLTTTCTGLVAGTIYRFTVAAVNGIGSSAASPESVNVRAPGLASAPASVSVTPNGAAGTALVTWSVVTNGGSPVTSFTVTSTPGNLTCTNTSGWFGRWCTVRGLSAGTAYTFHVTTTNAVGTSAPSVESSPVTLTSKPAPVASVNALIVPGTGGVAPRTSSATVSWTPGSNGGSAITAYNITAIPSSGVNCSWTAGNSGSCTGLAAGTSYQFSVTATNVVGTSNAKLTRAVVAPNVPGVPSSVTATATTRGSGDVLITWSAVPNGGSVVTGYTVTATPGGATCTNNAGWFGRWCTIKGLDLGTSYTFKVKATNAIGTGPESSASNSTMPIYLGWGPSVTLATDTVSAVVGQSYRLNATVTPNYAAGSVEFRDGSTLLSTVTVVAGAASYTVNSLTSGAHHFAAKFVPTDAVQYTIGLSNVLDVTPVEAPSVPQSVTVAAGLSRALVSWTAPASAGTGTITGYTVTANPGALQCTTNGALSCSVTGLTNSTAYSFTVTATNSGALTSAASSPVSGTPQAAFGSATLSPTSGTIDTGIAITTSTLCPIGDKVQGKIYGSGFPEAGFNVTSKTSVGAAQSGNGYRLDLLDTMRTFAADQSPAATLSGQYDIVISCYSGLSSTVLAKFNAASLYFTTPTDYTPDPAV